MSAEWMGIHAVWHALTGEEQRRVAREIVELRRSDTCGSSYCHVIAHALRMRESRVEAARDDELVALIQRAIPRLDWKDVRPMFVSIHFASRREMLAAIYDGIGIEHDKTEVAEEVFQETLDTERALGAIDPLLQEWPLKDLWFCFAVMRFACSDPWQAAVHAVASELNRRLDQQAVTTGHDEEQRKGSMLSELQVAGGASAAGDVISESADRAMTGNEEPKSANVAEFTTLDRAVIRGIVAALNGTHGAPDLLELDELVDELTELNDARAQSYFHRGFLDKLLDRELRAAGPGSNRERRVWYLSGWLQGALRRHEKAGLLAAYFELADVERDSLLEGSGTDGGAALASHIVPALLEGEQFSSAQEWLRVYFQRAARQLLPRITEWSRRALVVMSPEDVYGVLTLIDSQLSEAIDRHGSPPESMIRTFRRRLAITCRRIGRHTEAQTAVTDLLQTSTDAGERAKLLGDNALLAVGIRALEELRLPEPGKREAFLNAIHGKAELLRSATESDEPVPVAGILLSLPTVANPEAESEARNAAADLLRDAVMGMSRDDAEFWDRTGCLPRARVYLSVLELRDFDLPGLAGPAVKRLLLALESSIGIPDDLLKDAIEHAALQDVEGTAYLAQLALQKRPQKMLAGLEIRPLAARSRPFREAVKQALGMSQQQLTMQERFDGWTALLLGCLSADDRDSEMGVEALDRLEYIAHDDQDLAARLLGFLRERKHWEPAWEPRDAEEARVRLCLQIGQADEARACLSALAHRAISNGDHSDATDLIEQLESMQATTAELEALRQRVSVESGQVPSTDDTDGGEGERHAVECERSLQVLFLGGNETQARYSDGLRSFVKDRWSNVTLDAEFLGWSSNWGRQLKGLRHRMQKADVFVLMRFTRTQFGRSARKIASDQGKRWVSCSGHGRQSLERAIETAVRVASPK